jgi:hypothetical protein
MWADTDHRPDLQITAPPGMEFRGLGCYGSARSAGSYYGGLPTCRLSRRKQR